MFYSPLAQVQPTPNPVPSVKLDSRETPPPLHYSPTPSDFERISPRETTPRETTPVGTPKGFGPGNARKSDREKDLLFSWYRKTPEGFGGQSGVYVDSTLLDSDLDDSSFPLFGQTPPRDSAMNASRSTDFGPVPAKNSTSPRPQTSNLTSALQSTSGNEVRAAQSVNAGNGNGRAGRKESFGAGFSGMATQYGGSGAQPISMSGSNRAHPRRESLAGSMAGGMSWGGVSVGSWIRDDIMMQGTSPFPYQSPSFHSSSYLPKMEANFMRDFSCCGLTLPTLHELLQHYEEAHVWDKSDPNPLHHTQPQVSGPPDTRAAIAAAAVTNIQRQAQTDTKSSRPAPAAQTANTPQPSASHVGIPRSAQHHPHFGAGELPKMPLPPVQDMDSVDDMEMDDVPMIGIGSNLGSGFSSNNQPSNLYQPQERQQLLSRTQFGQPASVRVPPLDLNGLNFNNPLQGLRQSQPTTPVSGGRPGIIYHNNPTVSSVNTPTLSAHPLQQQFRQTPESSAPGTPGELDPEFIGTIGNMSMDNGQQFMPSQQQDYSVYGFGNGTANEMLDLCIDEPARRLYRANGALQNQAQIQARLGNNTVYTADSELAQRIREQQRKVGLADTVNGLNGEEAKPFRCPVIGCEKAYKNQNGLKYHKTHGHNTQKLHENSDGTFSIVDPTTLSPYPGTLGMEKEKPYKCEVCGKRYKNLNGLKYHKSHAPACDPEQNLRLKAGLPTTTSTLPGGSGFGLTGLEEEMVQ